MSREMVQTAVKLWPRRRARVRLRSDRAVERSYALLAQVITAYDLEKTLSAAPPPSRAASSA